MTKIHKREEAEVLLQKVTNFQRIFLELKQCSKIILIMCFNYWRSPGNGEYFQALESFGKEAQTPIEEADEGVAYTLFHPPPPHTHNFSQELWFPLRAVDLRCSKHELRRVCLALWTSVSRLTLQVGSGQIVRKPLTKIERVVFYMIFDLRFSKALFINQKMPHFIVISEFFIHFFFLCSFFVIHRLVWEFGKIS